MGIAAPREVKIGAQVFKVLERTRKEDGMLADGNYGYTLDEQNLIVIDASMHISKKRVTLLHEVLHAARMIWESPVKPKKSDEFETWEHYFIGIYETAILLVLKDNKELVEWLQSED
jgi:hypothetical protein